MTPLSQSSIKISQRKETKKKGSKTDKDFTIILLNWSPTEQINPVITAYKCLEQINLVMKQNIRKGDVLTEQTVKAHADDWKAGKSRSTASPFPSPSSA